MDHNSLSDTQPLTSASISSNLDTLDRLEFQTWNTQTIDDPEYADLVKQAEKAIQSGILPIRIPAGSSGSYFVRNLEGKTIGVFKPKDEEPYGRSNPKWTKWLQRRLCPCCFGRSCLVPNQGYLSEAGASIIDAKLRLNLVPKTRAIRLASNSFNYPAYERHIISARDEINQSVGRQMLGRQVFPTKGLRAKIGSFQLFVENYVDADIFLKQLENNTLSEEALDKFQKQFERLVVLDYIIRNTDRNNSNWLVKYEPKAYKDRNKLLQSLANPQLQSESQDIKVESVKDGDVIDEVETSDDVRIAAIDNGLAFPFKHPDEWRAYPFHWAWLRQAKIPFSEEIKSHILPFLSDMNFIQHELCDEIQRLFSQDKNYDRRIVERQLSVMRGQILNLAQAMRDGKSPFELVQMPGVLVERLHAGSSPGQKQFKQKYSNRYPLFSWF